jgi:hypothetical protein
MKMKKTLIAMAATTIVAVTGAGSAGAQDLVVYVPVDLMTCNYNDNKGPADLAKVVARWNDYMDKQNSDSYAAWVMNKVYTSPDQDFDFGWLAAHRSGETMGTGNDSWMENGGELRAEFAKVATCDGSTNFASRRFKAPPEGNVPEDGVLSFSDCNVVEGADWNEVVAATEEWARILGEAGSQAAMYHFYPVFGGGDVAMVYKEVWSYPNFTEFGKDYDRMGNGGLYWQGQELLEGLVECDVSRVYHATNQRMGKIRD